MVSDPIADFLNRIKNASRVGAREVEIPYSIMKHGLADVLKSKGFVEDVAKKGKKERKILSVTLPEKARGARNLEMARLSRPSRRIYIQAKDIKPVRHGLGLVVLSTPKGILSGEEAKKENVGGELLCKIW